MASLFSGLAVAVSVALFLYWLWAWRMAADLAESARQRFEQLQASGSDLVAGVDEARFREVFHRVHFPRFPKYALAIVAAFIVALPATFGLLAAIAWSIDVLGMSANADALARSIPIAGAADRARLDDGETIALYYVQNVLHFYYYFGLVFVWLAIVFVAMRRYHRRRPGLLQEEMAKEKAKD